MTRRTTRRFFLGGLGALTATGAAGHGGTGTERGVPPRPRMRPAAGAAAGIRPIETLIAEAELSGEVACAVADTATGARLEAVRGDSAMPPASVAKALTALYALEMLGPEYRFATRLMTTGALGDGILGGDLILVGGGDPGLDTDDLAALAGQLKAAGIREIRGAFKVYDGALPYVRAIDGMQPAYVGYNPAVSGIALNHNRVHFEWKRLPTGYAVTMDARTERYRPEVDIARMRVIERRMPVYTYAERAGADQWTVASQALGRGGRRWLPVRRPAAYAGDVFRTMARAQGIVLPRARTIRRLPPRTTTVAARGSDPLKDIVKGMLRYSNNLTAEMVGLAASAAWRARAPASLRESAAQMSRWAAARLAMTATDLVDHSGLGDASRMTAQDLVDALVQVRGREILKPLLKPFDMRDENGRVQKAHPIKVSAKTGTLNFVSGLGGFMTGPDGTELAFAIFAADTATRARLAPADREVPPGARGWNKKSRQLQQKLIERWGTLYGS